MFLLFVLDSLYKYEKKPSIVFILNKEIDESQWFCVVLVNYKKGSFKGSYSIVPNVRMNFM